MLNYDPYNTNPEDFKRKPKKPTEWIKKGPKPLPQQNPLETAREMFGDPMQEMALAIAKKARKDPRFTKSVVNSTIPGTLEHAMAEWDKANIGYPTFGQGQEGNEKRLEYKRQLAQAMLYADPSGKTKKVTEKTLDYLHRTGLASPGPDFTPDKPQIPDNARVSTQPTEDQQVQAMNPWNDPFKQSGKDYRPDYEKLDEAAKVVQDAGRELGKGAGEVAGTVAGLVPGVNPALSQFAGKEIGGHVGEFGGAVLATPMTIPSAAMYSADPSKPPIDRAMSALNFFTQVEGTFGAPFSGPLIGKALQKGSKAVLKWIDSLTPKAVEQIAQQTGKSVEELTHVVDTLKHDVQDPEVQNAFDRTAFTEGLKAKEGPLEVGQGVVAPENAIPEHPALSIKNPAYHGTSVENAKAIEQQGLVPGSGRGMSGRGSSGFLYVTPDPKAANWYGADNFLNKNGSQVLKGHVTGKILKVSEKWANEYPKGVMPEYEALRQASEQLGVPLLDRSMIDISGIRNAMREQGYGAIEFRDAHGNTIGGANYPRAWIVPDEANAKFGADLTPEPPVNKPDIAVKTAVEPVQTPETVPPVSEPTAPETAPEPIVETPPAEAPPVEPQVPTGEGFQHDPNATGLANQVQDREAGLGIIQEVLKTDGKSAEHFQSVGEHLVASGADYETLATQVGLGKAELTGENVGILLAGKAEQMRTIRMLRNRVEAGDKGALKDLVKAEEKLTEYLDDIQAGKGRWSDTGRAMQAGTGLDTGNYVEVLQRAERSGRTNPKTNEELKAQADEIFKLQEAAKAKDAELGQAKAELDDIKRQVAEGNLADLVEKHTAPRKFNKVAIAHEHDAIKAQLAALKKKPGVKKGKQTGAALLPDPEVIALKRQLIVNRIKAGAATIEDLVIAVNKTWHEVFGEKLESQDIIDTLALKGERRALTPEQVRVRQLTGQARRESTWAKAEKFLKDSKDIDERAALKELRDAKKGAWSYMKDQQRAWEAGERIKNSEARKAYKDWWNVQADIMDAKQKMATGNVGPEPPKTRPPDSPEMAAMKAERADWKARVKTQQGINEAQGQLDSGIFVAKAKKVKEVSKELEDLQVKKQILDARVKGKLDELNTPKSLLVLKKAARGLQGLKLGSDVGMLTRQGLFVLKKPGTFAKSFGEALKSAASDENMVRWQNNWDTKRIDGVSFYKTKKNAGMSTPDVLMHDEELVALRFAKKLGVKLGRLQHIPGALERFQKTFINHARNMEFEKAVRAGFNERELKGTAHYLNNVTGRGNLPSMGKSLNDVATIVMTSKNYEASRWGTLSEPVRNILQIAQKDPVTKAWSVNRASARNLADLVAQGVAVAGFYKACEAAGYKVSMDPDSPDFLKLRKGKEVWDVSAGLAPRLRDILLVIGAWQHPSYKNNLRAALGKSVARVVTPGLTVPAQVVSSRVFQKDSDKKINWISGAPSDKYDDSWEAFLPMVTTAISQAVESDSSAFGSFFKEFVGGSENFYGEKEPKGPPKPKAKNANTSPPNMFPMKSRKSSPLFQSKSRSKSPLF